jgi:MEMO1 family protein
MGSAHPGKTSASKNSSMNGTNSTVSSSPYYECRNAEHAGSWYPDDKEQLVATLERYLRQVEATKQQQVEQTSLHTSSNFASKTKLRALICPHAGYSYSGATAAYSYSALLEELIRPKLFPSTVGSSDCGIRQIVVLHPSHHVPLRGKCAVSGARVIATPLGNLQVDTTLRDEILLLASADKKHNFSIMTQEEDENEHSGEMQYPYIAHVLHQAEALLNTFAINQITVTPIMCGSLTTADEIAYGALLSEILNRPSILTIVSTDFCHWGRRFGYQPTTAINSIQQQFSSSTASTTIPIYQIIQQLDRRGMDLIEAKEPGAFASYLRETNNTICGRHAVSVWLRSVTTRAQTAEVQSLTGDGVNSLSLNECTVQFIHYEQSSQSKTLSDSSVSYAAGIATLPV